LASRLVTTVATTSVWDALRSTETETIASRENPENTENSENPEQPPESGAEPEFSDDPGMISQNQTMTETQIIY
ncbi:MAG: hypothetical protein K2G25_05310, partial [Oscillospiraceae bacterium]|nr:hypothetical protein [Oscillospiraceae bacterium]